MILDHEEIEILAYNLYKEGRSYDENIRRLAELCMTIAINIDAPQIDEWCDMNAFRTIEELAENLKYNYIKKPTEEQIKPLIEKLKRYRPEHSKLHWFIAEKMLILDKLKEKLKKQQNKETIDIRPQIKTS